MGETAWGAAGRIPAEGRCSVSTGQRENLEAIMGQLVFPAQEATSASSGAAPGAGIGAAAVRLLIQRVEGERDPAPGSLEFRELAADARKG